MSHDALRGAAPRYTEDERAVWAELFTTQCADLERSLCPALVTGFEALALCADTPPSCAYLSRTLRAATGWSSEPVVGLVPVRAFFRMLSERVFPTNVHVRSREALGFSTVPDLLHEVGHCAMLMNPTFARFAQGHAGSVHVDDEHRDAPVLGCVDIGAGDEDAAVANVRQRRPHLLAVDDPLVAVSNGTGLEARHIGAGTGLGEHLAPDLVRPDQLRLVGGALLVGAVLVEHRQAHPLADAEVDLHDREGTGLFAPDPLVLVAQALPAVLDRVRQAGEARIGECRLILLGLRQLLVATWVVGLQDPDAGGVLGQEVSAALPEGVEVVAHGCWTSSVPVTSRLRVETCPVSHAPATRSISSISHRPSANATSALDHSR